MYMKPPTPNMDGIVERQSSYDKIALADRLPSHETGDNTHPRNTMASLNGTFSFTGLNSACPRRSDRVLDEDEPAMPYTGSWTDQNVVSRSEVHSSKRPRASPFMISTPRKRHLSHTSPQSATGYTAENSTRHADNHGRQVNGVYEADHERDARSTGLQSSFSRSHSRQSSKREPQYHTYATVSSQIHTFYPHEGHVQHHGSPPREGANSGLGEPFGHERSPHGAKERNIFAANRPRSHFPQAPEEQMGPYQQERSLRNPPSLRSPLYANSAPILRQRDERNNNMSRSRERAQSPAPFTTRNQRARSPYRDYGFNAEPQPARRSQTPSIQAHNKVYINCSDNQLQDTSGLISLDIVGSSASLFKIGRSQRLATHTPQHERLQTGECRLRTPLSQNHTGSEDQKIEDFDFGTTPLLQMLRNHPRKPLIGVEGSPYDPRKVLPRESIVFKKRVHRRSQTSRLAAVDSTSGIGSGARGSPIDLLSPPELPPPQGFRSTPMKERLPPTLRPTAPKKTMAPRPAPFKTPTPKAKVSAIDPQLARQQQAAAVIMSRETKVHDEELQKTIFGALIESSTRAEEERARASKRQEAERQRKEKERLEEDARAAEDSARQLQQEQEAELKRIHDAQVAREKQAQQAKLNAQRRKDKIFENQRLEENRRRAVEKLEADRRKAEAERDAKAAAKMLANTVQAEPAKVAEIKLKQELGKIQAASLTRSSLFPKEKPEKIHVSPYANDESLFITGHDESLDTYDVDERARGKLTGPSSAMEVMAAARSDKLTFQDARAQFERDKKEREDRQRRERCGERTRKMWEARAAAAANSDSNQPPTTSRRQNRATRGPTTRKPRQAPKSKAKAKGPDVGGRDDSMETGKSSSPTATTRFRELSPPRMPEVNTSIPAAANTFKTFKEFAREKETEKVAVARKRPRQAHKATRHRSEPTALPPTAGASSKVAEAKFRAKCEKKIRDRNEANGHGYSEDMIQMYVRMEMDARREFNARNRAKARRGSGESDPFLNSAPSRPRHSPPRSPKNTEETSEEAAESESQPIISKPCQSALAGLEGPMIAATEAPRASYGNLPHKITVKDLQRWTSKASLAAHFRSDLTTDSEDSAESEEDPDDDEVTAAYQAVQKMALPNQETRPVDRLVGEGENLMEKDRLRNALKPDEHSAQILGPLAALSSISGPIVPQTTNEGAEVEFQAVGKGPDEEPRVYFVNQTKTYDSEADADKISRLGEFHNREEANAFAAEKVKEYREAAGEPCEVTVEYQKGFYFCQLSHDDHRATVFWVAESGEDEAGEDFEQQASEPKTPPPRAKSWDVYLEITDEKGGDDGEKHSILKGSYAELAMANRVACNILSEYVRPTSANDDDTDQYKELQKQLEPFQGTCSETMEPFVVSLDIDEESIPWMRGEGVKNVTVSVEEHKFDNTQR